MLLANEWHCSTPEHNTLRLFQDTHTPALLPTVDVTELHQSRPKRHAVSRTLRKCIAWTWPQLVT